MTDESKQDPDKIGKFGSVELEDGQLDQVAGGYIKIDGVDGFTDLKRIILFDK